MCLFDNGFDPTCHCEDGWEGELCTEDIDECASAPCQNKGECSTEGIFAGYTCKCLAVGSLLLLFDLTIVFLGIQWHTLRGAGQLLRSADEQ